MLVELRVAPGVRGYREAGWGGSVRRKEWVSSPLDLKQADKEGRKLHDRRATHVWSMPEVVTPATENTVNLQK
jgi:hypothetical protein